MHWNINFLKTQHGGGVLDLQFFWTCFMRCYHDDSLNDLSQIYTGSTWYLRVWKGRVRQFYADWDIIYRRPKDSRECDTGDNACENFALKWPGCDLGANSIIYGISYLIASTIEFEPYGVVLTVTVQWRWTSIVRGFSILAYLYGEQYHLRVS